MGFGYYRQGITTEEAKIEEVGFSYVERCVEARREFLFPMWRILFVPGINLDERTHKKGAVLRCFD